MAKRTKGKSKKEMTLQHTSRYKYYEDNQLENEGKK